MASKTSALALACPRVLASSITLQALYSRGRSLARWLSGLEHRPVHRKVSGSIPGQGTHLGFRFRYCFSLCKNKNKKPTTYPWVSIKKKKQGPYSLFSLPTGDFNQGWAPITNWLSLWSQINNTSLELGWPIRNEGSLTNVQRCWPVILSQTDCQMEGPNK